MGSPQSCLLVVGGTLWGVGSSSAGAPQFSTMAFIHIEGVMTVHALWPGSTVPSHDSLDGQDVRHRTLGGLIGALVPTWSVAREADEKAKYSPLLFPASIPIIRPSSNPMKCDTYLILDETNTTGYPQVLKNTFETGE